ncbi:MAG: hypothetical protein K2H41_02845 [Acetatifactor sp.]|nr:hypothetical protein [Acetatifactor sp.]
MNEKVKLVKFVGKATVAHFVSYLICGLIFSKLFNYEVLFKLDNVQYFMRDAYGSSSLIGPFVQILRGAMIGSILLILKDNVLKKKHSWLYLWIIFAGLGIICTPAASPVSIEGIVYTQLPLEFHLKTAPELFVQTLLFSLWVTGDFKFKIPEKVKIPAIVTAISGVGFSLGGIILACVLKVDVMASASDPFAFVIMFIALTIVFFMTKLYVASRKRWLPFIYYIVCYMSLAGLPTAYNYFANSLLKSPLSLIFSGLPVIAIGIYLFYTQHSHPQS